MNNSCPGCQIRAFLNRHLRAATCPLSSMGFFSLFLCCENKKCCWLIGLLQGSLLNFVVLEMSFSQLTRTYKVFSPQNTATYAELEQWFLCYPKISWDAIKMFIEFIWLCALWLQVCSMTVLVNGWCLMYLISPNFSIWSLKSTVRHDSIYNFFSSIITRQKSLLIKLEIGLLVPEGEF